MAKDHRLPWQTASPGPRAGRCRLYLGNNGLQPDPDTESDGKQLAAMDNGGHITWNWPDNRPKHQAKRAHEQNKDSTTFFKERFPRIWKGKRVTHFSFSTAC